MPGAYPIFVMEESLSLATSMGEIGKQRQLNEMAHGTRSRLLQHEIFKFLFKHCLMNETDIFLIWLKQYFKDISLFISFKAGSKLYFFVFNDIFRFKQYLYEFFWV